MNRKFRRIKNFLGKLGPGLVTGAADDDPSGIATYSQAGAAYGLRMLWMTVVMLPMMVVIQEMVGRIGLVTGKGLANNIRQHYNRWFLYFAVFFLVFANTVNIGANIGAMAAASRLLVDIPYVWMTMFFTIGIVLLEVIMPYKRYAKVLKWLSISLFAYIITAFIVDQPWREVIKATITPHIELSGAFILTIVAVLGTTISPYLFFWEPSQEVEEELKHNWLKAEGEKPQISSRKIRNFRWDNFAGMVFSEIIAFFIILTAASTLHKQGITDIPNAAQAAQALEPLVRGFPNAGVVAKSIFAMGIIGTGLLAIPVLAGSAAYAVSEALGIKEGLSKKILQAKGFYGVIAGATLTGLMINFVGIDPIKALFYAAVINGVMAVPLIYLIIRISSNEKVMGKYKNKFWTNFIGVVTLLAMFSASIAMIFVR
ncbi:MAG: Nramp family divalent metal transporter [bacterium]|nr:Nramp family divalent metal transporter [bacterium]